MNIRNVGVEEEFLLVDSATGEAQAVAGAVLRAAAAQGGGPGAEDPDYLEFELQKQQVEINTSRGALIHNAAANGGKPIEMRQAHNDMRGEIAELLGKAIGAGALDQEFSAHDKERMRAFLRSRSADSDGGVSRESSKYRTRPLAEAASTRNLISPSTRVPDQASVEPAAICGSSGAESGEKREGSSSAAAKRGFQSASSSDAAGRDGFTGAEKPAESGRRKSSDGSGSRRSGNAAQRAAVSFAHGLF